MATAVHDVHELPKLPKRPTCPAALRVEGAMLANCGVICREMQQDQEADAGLDMTAGQLGQVRDGEGGVFISMKQDPSTVVMFCHGSGVPVVTDDDGQGRPSYTYCSVWQEARKRHLAGKRGLTDPVIAEATSMGVDEEIGNAAASHQASDPIAAGLRGLDELTERA